MPTAFQLHRKMKFKFHFRFSFFFALLKKKTKSDFYFHFSIFPAEKEMEFEFTLCSPFSFFSRALKKTDFNFLFRYSFFVFVWNLEKGFNQRLLSRFGRRQTNGNRWRTEKVRCIYFKENIQVRYKETKSQRLRNCIHSSSVIQVHSVLHKSTDFI